MGVGDRRLIALGRLEHTRLRFTGLTLLWAGLFSWLLVHSSAIAAGDGQRAGVLGAQHVLVGRTPTVTVPRVTGQAYVFAKIALEQASFAWRVVGPVEGYAGDVVITQKPAAGTHVVDNGAPTVTLRLARNSAYAEVGLPENAAPYPGAPARVSARR